MISDDWIKSSAKSKNSKLSQCKPLKQVVAAFDFDGTVTRRDSLVPFLFFLKGRWKALYMFCTLAPTLVLFLFGLISRQATKEKILNRFLDKTPIDLLRQKGAEFAQGQINRIMRPQALEKIQWHQSQGHCCVIISASIDIYLIPWAKQNGFDAVIASQLFVDSEANITGRLQGKNCWGDEKPRRLLSLMGNKADFYLYAYGDSRGDRELLSLADEPFYCSF